MISAAARSISLRAASRARARPSARRSGGCARVGVPRWPWPGAAARSCRRGDEVDVSPLERLRRSRGRRTRRRAACPRVAAGASSVVVVPMLPPAPALLSLPESPPPFGIEVAITPRERRLAATPSAGSVTRGHLMPRRAWRGGAREAPLHPRVERAGEGGVRGRAVVAQGDGELGQVGEVGVDRAAGERVVERGQLAGEGVRRAHRWPFAASGRRGAGGCRRWRRRRRGRRPARRCRGRRGT